MQLRFPLLSLFLILLVAITAGCQTASSQSSTAKPSPTASTSSAAQSSTSALPTAQAAQKQYSAPPPMTIDPNKTYAATLHTSMGDIKIDLFPKDAPKTVNNFVFLARDGFYTNVKFHRIVKGFMVQTGDPTGTGRGGPGYQFADEPITKDYKRGIVAMANAGPNTNGSQFFIVHADTPLPKNYTIFGQVTDKESLDVLDKIANVPVGPSATGEMSAPKQNVVITGVDIAEK